MAVVLTALEARYLPVLDPEWLLSRAKNLDPVGDSWGHLMRRAPSRAWKEL
jgi:hypothetical protein